MVPAGWVGSGVSWSTREHGISKQHKQYKQGATKRLLSNSTMRRRRIEVTINLVQKVPLGSARIHSDPTTFGSKENSARIYSGPIHLREQKSPADPLGFARIHLKRIHLGVQKKKLHANPLGVQKESARIRSALLSSHPPPGQKAPLGSARIHSDPLGSARIRSDPLGIRSL